jgi:hypothetical protein
MSTDRSAAIALIAGSAAGLLTMGLHPSGHDVIRNASTGQVNALANAVHALALLAQPLMLAGTLVLTLKLRTRRDIAVVAYLFFAMASITATVAGVASGFLAPDVVSGMAGADAPAQAMMMNMFHYTGLLNQTFAKMHVMFVGIAFFAWSMAMLGGREMTRGLAVYGMIVGVLLPVGVVSGHLTLDVHGFGLVVLAESVWMVWVAAQLWRSAAR